MNYYKLFHPDLTHDNIWKSLIAFSFPLMLSYIFQQLYNASDSIIVGHFLGEDSLAAIGSCTAISELLIGFGTGFGNGLGIVCSRHYGSLNIRNLKNATFSSIIITFFVTLLIMISGQLGLKKLLTLLGTPASIIDEAYSYIWTVAIFSGVLFAYNLLSGLLRAIGNSFMPLVFLIIASILNIGLDLLFVIILKQGVRGSSIATVIAQGISAILCLIYIIGKNPVLLPEKENLKIDKKIFRDLIGQGLSMALMSALVSSGSVILQSSINSFDNPIIAGHISARKIFAFTIIPLITLGLSSSTFVSQNLGAGKIDRIKKGIKISNLLCLSWGILCTSTIPFFAEKLIHAISGSSSPELIDYGKKYISFMQPFYGILGVLFVSRNSLQGLGSKFIPLISSIIELAGKIIFTLLIIPKIGIWGIIICEPLIWVLMTIQLLFSLIQNPLLKKVNKEKTKN